MRDMQLRPANPPADRPTPVDSARPEPEMLVAFRPGGPFAMLAEPVLLVGQANAHAVNPAAVEIAADDRAMDELFLLGSKARRSRTSVRKVVATLIDRRPALIEFDVSAWGEDFALAIGRDVTVTIGVREALAVSRERYRALLEIAVDCMWETSIEGALELVSPNIIHGRSAALMIGMNLRDLITCRTAGFYSARQPRTWLAAGLKAHNGELVLGAAIIEPIIDPETKSARGYRGCFRRSDKPVQA